MSICYNWGRRWITELGITGTDRGHKLKLLAIEVNPAIPNLGIQAKPKSVKRKFEETNVSMPAPPSKKVLTELDSSMVGWTWWTWDQYTLCANHYWKESQGKT